MTELIKQDINFLECPLWFQDVRTAIKNDTGYVWKDKDGYVYRTGYKPTTKGDNIFLLFLLLKSQHDNWKSDLYLTRYEIVKGCGLNIDQRNYKRLEDSLERWENVRVKFKGTFYDGNTYQTLNFGIIDTWAIDKHSKKLWIRFSPEWLMRIKLSDFFKLIDFNKIKSLRSPLATRLYEILIKTFQGRNLWKIDALKLAAKIPMNLKYASHVAAKIKPAINRISKYTELKLSVEIQKPKRGKIIFVFRKRLVEDQQEIQSLETTLKTLPAPEPVQNQNPKIQNQVIETTPVSTISENILTLIPQEYLENQDVLKNIRKYLKTHNEEYVINQIQYARQNFKKEGGFPGYFAQSLKNGWGNGLEEEKRKKKQIAEAKAEQEAKLKAKHEAEEKLFKILNEEFETYLENKVDEVLGGLPKDERVTVQQKFQEDFLSRGDIYKRRWKQGGLDNMFVKHNYDFFIAERFLSEEDSVFEIWVKNKGYKLVQKPDGTYKLAL
ncbi:conserved hypothetical protein [Candidatus Magnetomoraceae bacterium gMMP-13]